MMSSFILNRSGSRITFSLLKHVSLGEDDASVKNIRRATQYRAGMFSTSEPKIQRCNDHFRLVGTVIAHQ